MKKFIFLSIGFIFSAACAIKAGAQDNNADDIENYVKSNVALTKFKVLGVTKKQYAKCLEAVNYLEPDKKPGMVIIGKTYFADDGKGYDLIANDGVLTSNELFPYSGAVYAPGTYHETPDYNVIVADEIFAHRSQLSELTIKIGCKLKWVKCRDMPHPHDLLCKTMGWPYGGFELVECEFEIHL